LGKDDFTVESVVVYKRLAGECPMVNGRDTWWHDEMDKVTADCDCEWVESEHPLFMLYTSGSTGKPKGIVHTTAGYMLGAWSTFKYTFDYKPGEVYWCTADIGWITGHSYIVYGPLLERATTVMFEVRVFYVLSDCLPVLILTLCLCFITYRVCPRTPTPADAGPSARSTR
jgi:acetyl-CoA synthetase